MSKIVVLDGTDVPNPEDLAMLQALYSRSPASVTEHLEKVRASGSGHFMDKYYVGFGHSSVGDGGDTTVFIEDVSMLAAKAFQDWALYSGQEASTRYMDFSKTRIEDPLGTDASRTIQERWMEFYHSARPQLLEHLLQRYPRQESESPEAYNGAIRARSFDVLRAFLPAGASTNLSWHTNLRQAADKLQWMIVHPDPIIAGVSQRLAAALHEKYTHSRFAMLDADPVATEFRRSVMLDYAYNDDEPVTRIDPLVWIDDTIRSADLLRVSHITRKRPRKAELPPFLASLGSVRSRFALDFGSFRDLQRHRNGVVRMPLLTTRHGFHDWYINELPKALQDQAEELIAAQTTAINKIRSAAGDVVAQYYTAMGFLVTCDVTQGLPGFVYRLELRTSKTVHPTLRQVVQAEARIFAERFPDIRLYVDMDPDDWTVRRGSQTITEKA